MFDIRKIIVTLMMILVINNVIIWFVIKYPDLVPSWILWILRLPNLILR